MKSRFLLLFSICLLWTGLALAKVDINTASRDELDALKGVGPTKAAAIIDYRRKNGPFRAIDDLQQVKGFGPKSVDALRSEIYVGNAGNARIAERAAPAVAPASKDESYPKPAVARPAAPSARPAAPMSPAHPVAAPSESRPLSSAPRPAAPAAPARPPEVKPVSPPSQPSAPAKPASPAKSAAPAVTPAAAATPTPAPRPAAPPKPAQPARPAMGN